MADRRSRSRAEARAADSGSARGRSGPLAARLHVIRTLARRLRRLRGSSASTGAARLGTAFAELLHLQPEGGRPWNGLAPVLLLAFAVRAAVALSGEFVLHPDEVMQYLEQAHRLVYGQGVQYWEYFFGARSWIVPGAIAGVLKAFDLAGLGQPSWYVGGVKLALCAVSLAVPAGMYFFARRHFGESTARVALVAGALWYELVGFAHKPMTEFVATAPLLGLAALCVRPSVDDARTVWLSAFLAVLTAAVRMQYAPLALLLLAVVFLRTRRKLTLVLAAAVFAFAVGVFDGATWDGRLFHSYVLNLRYNLLMSQVGRAGESPPYQYLWWLVLASGGAGMLCLLAALAKPRRYGFVLALIAIVVLLHSLQAHKEYRFVFTVIPLWLVLGADLVVRLAAGDARKPWITAVAGAVFAGVTLAGILNALPYQQHVYQAWSQETPFHWFVRRSDPIFAAWRHLARAPGVKSVWQIDRPYHQTPGYYYLHRHIPFYDGYIGRHLIPDTTARADFVSHIVVSEHPGLSIPGYSVEKTFGRLRILRRDENERPVRRWLDHAPITVGPLTRQIMRRLDPYGPSPPGNYGIRFSETAPPPPGELKPPHPPPG